MAGEIVLGYDESDGSQAALEQALRLCADLGAELVVVFAYTVAIPERESADFRHTLEEIGQEATRTALGRASDAGVSARPEIRHERPADAILEVADECDARMIVVGSHGEGPITGALLGATPYRLLHRAQRPVLVVRG
jgi:nucleotide-binding universal stress UspA family protein